MSGQDIVRFLYERIDEDESAAREALRALEPAAARGRAILHRYGATRPVVERTSLTYSDDDAGPSVHIAPERVLREVAAKRVILDHVVAEQCQDMWALGALASVYGDHPDYDPEWSA